MLEREKPEAVSVAVPTHEHFPVVHELLEAGCHVLVEKPIAATLEEGQKLIETADRLGLVLAVGHIERFNPAVIELKRRLDAGDLGRVFQIHVRRIGPFPTRIQDVGVILDLTTHDLDIMRHLTGCEVKGLYAESSRELHDSCEDMVCGILRFEDGVIGLLEINWLTPTKIRELHVTGERGMFSLNYITQDLTFYENAEARGGDWEALHLLRGVTEGSVTRFAIKKQEPLRVELESFIARVQGKDVGIVDGHDAQEALRLAIAMAETASSGELKKV
jgi:predicted dehydrogenase